VQVVMTDAAQRFVSAMSFQAVSGRPTRSDLWDSAAEAAMGHIEFARWARDRADRAGERGFHRAARGRPRGRFAGDTVPRHRSAHRLAPAMNRVMWANKATQANIRTLISRGVRVLGPGVRQSGVRRGRAGRMWEPAKLAESLLEPPPNAGILAGLNVLITAGPRANASIRSAISPTAAREKWGLPSPRRRARPARTSPS
jgi:phosphopantothenoylcysteine decarboxylase / phosphopantothenate---cysteine ligase